MIGNQGVFPAGLLYYDLLWHPFSPSDQFEPSEKFLVHDKAQTKPMVLTKHLHTFTRTKGKNMHFTVLPTPWNSKF